MSQQRYGVFYASVSGERDAAYNIGRGCVTWRDERHVHLNTLLIMTHDPVLALSAVSGASGPRHFRDVHNEQIARTDAGRGRRAVVTDPVFTHCQIAPHCLLTIHK